jgi:hypothetical protein
MEDDMKYKHLLTAFILISAILASPAMVLASDLTDAQYYGTIQITNNSTANSTLATVMTLSSSELIDQGWTDDDFENVAIRNSAGADVPFMPSTNSTNPWCLWIPSIGDYAINNDILYTGNASLSSTKYYFPGATGMAVSDDATLELGGDGLINISGYIDTTAVGENITVKEDSLRTYISGSGNITSVLPTWVSPTSNSSSTGWTTPEYAYDGNTATRAYIDFAETNDWSDYLVIDRASTTTSQIRYWLNYEAGISKASIDVYYAAGWHNILDGASTQGEWVTLDIPAGEVDVTSVRIRFYNTTGNFKSGSLYELELSRLITVTAPSISSAEHVVTTAIKTPFFGLGVDAWGDTSGHETDGLVVSALPAWESFDGKDDALVIPHNANQLLTDGGTIEAWIKPSSMGEGVGGNSGRIVDKSRTGYSDDGYWLQVAGNAGSARVQCRINHGTGIDSGSITYGNWYHIAVTISNTGLITLYVNGVQSGTPGISADPAGITTTNPLTIGNRSGATDRTFDGLIGGVEVLSEIWTPAQIAADYALGPPEDPILPDVDNLQVNLPLPQTECSVSPFTSIDDNELTCTVSEAVWTEDEGYTFDGENDSIAVTHHASQLLTTGGTIEAWIKPATVGEPGLIVDKSSNFNGVNGYAFGLSSSDDNAYFIINSGTFRKTAYGAIISGDGNWYHVVATWDNTGYTTIYVNGSQSGTPGISADPAGITTTNALTIGNRSTATDRTFDGVIGDVRLYSYPLSSDDVLRNYNATKTRYGHDGDIYTYSTLETVPDNANDLVIAPAAVMPYMQYAEVYAGEVQTGYWEWKYDTTFTDLSGNGNDATPSFRTTSSDADVSAELISFLPISTAIAPAYTISGAPDFITGNITTSGNFTSGAVGAGGPPGFSLVDDAATSGGTPNIWLWGLLGGLTIAMTGLFLTWMEKNYGSGTGSLLLRMGIAIFVYGLLIAFDKFDFWMLVMYLFIAIAPAMASRHVDWGGYVSQLNIIGFLSMSWIGLTAINRILEGQFITAAETAYMNTLMFTQEFNLFGMFNIPVMNFQFFTEGIPRMVKWDYSFFGGNAQMFQYLLYSITAVVSFIIFMVIIGLLYNYFNRSR